MTDPEHGGRDRDVLNGTNGVWEDRRVLEGVQRREPQALGRFFDASFPYVYNLAYRLTGNRDTAEDVVQDVFLKVYRAADRLDVHRHPKPWLTTITYNTCRDLARRTAARPEDSVDARIIEDTHATSETPEDVTLRRERERLVEQALAELDERSRTIVILNNYCGFSHEQIAAIVDMSHAAVRKNHSRAIKRMAGIIERLQQ
ncbi:MAG: RNA polymerase sigma factor [Candidatus Latescibacterota bacterium]|nr:MAG: RNA polymerase sigma factor [Candidatus Latescibacterota bacterium]